MHLQKLLEVERHAAGFALPFSQIVVADHVLIELVLRVESKREIVISC